MSNDTFDIVIAGSGMAGLTAAIYAGRADLDILVYEGDEPGGQLTLTTDVENYPGFPDGVGGVELIEDTKEQAKKFGAEFRYGVIEDVELKENPIIIHTSNDTEVTCNAFIVASGASARWVGAENEDELMGNGLSTCATCDGAFHRDDTVLVIGGGDSAMEESLFLTKFAEEVYVVHRRDELRASEIMKKRAMDNDKIEFMWNTELLEIYGDEEEGITGAKLARHPDGHPKEKLEQDGEDVDVFDYDCNGIFYAIGHTPNTEFLKGADVDMDEQGYINTLSGRTTETTVEGVFAAGDVSDSHYQQAVTAAGMGCMAAMDAEDWLEQKEREGKEKVEAD